MLRFLAAGCLLLGVAFDARAADDVAAEVAFDAGLRALADGDVDRACPLFARAVDLSPKRPIGGLMKLGECNERAGKTASAWSAYREAFGLAQQENDARRALAEESVTRLDAILQRVTVKLDPVVAGREGLIVTLGNRTLPNELFGVPVPVDPGATTLRIELPGIKPRLLAVTLPPPGGTVEIEVSRWEEESLSTGPMEQPPSATPEGSRFGGLGWAGVGVGGAGAALLAFSLGLVLEADSAYEEALADEAHECEGGVCNQAGKEAVADARATGVAATGVFVAGSVLTAAGLVMIIIDLATVEDPAQPPGPRLSLHALSLRSGMQGVWIEGQF